MEELKKNIEGIDSAEKATAVFIDFAKEKGFDFTAEDIAELEAEAQKELSGEELDKVNAAGTGWFVGRNDKKLHPASTIKITAEQQKDFRFLTLLFPLKKGAAPPTAKRISETTWEITCGDTVCTLNLSDLTENFKAE